MSATHLQTEHYTGSARIVDAKTGKVVLRYDGKSSHRRIEYAYQMILLGWMLHDERIRNAKGMETKTRSKTMQPRTVQATGDSR
jgi:hypothetical protein